MNNFHFLREVLSHRSPTIDDVLSKEDQQLAKHLLGRGDREGAREILARAQSTGIEQDIPRPQLRDLLLSWWKGIESASRLSIK